MDSHLNLIYVNQFLYFNVRCRESKHFAFLKQCLSLFDIQLHPLLPRLTGV